MSCLVSDFVEPFVVWLQKNVALWICIASVCVCVCRLWVCLLLFSSLCLRFSLKQAFLYYHVVLTFGEWIGIESEKSSCNRYLVFFSRVYLLIPLKERKIELYWRFPIMNALKNGSDIHVHKYENIYSHVFCPPERKMERDFTYSVHIPAVLPATAAVHTFYMCMHSIFLVLFLEFYFYFFFATPCFYSICRRLFNRM